MSLKLFLAAVGFILAICAIVYFLTPKSELLSGNALRDAEQKAEKEYRAQGLPWEAKDNPGSRIPKTRTALKILTAFATPPKDASIAYDLQLKSVIKGDTAVAAKVVAAANPSLDAAQKLLATKDLYFGYDFDQGGMLLFPEYAEMKSYAKGFCLRADIEAVSGDHDATSRDLHSALHIGELSSKTPTLFGVLVKISILSIVSKSLAVSNYALQKRGVAKIPTDDFATAFMKPLPLKEALATDAYLYLAASRNWYAGLKGFSVSNSISGWPADDVEANYELCEIRYWTEVFKGVRNNWNDPAQLAKALQAAGRAVPFLRHQPREYYELYDRDLYGTLPFYLKLSNTRIAAHELYFAAADYIRTHGSAPADLTSLKSIYPMSDVKAFQYRRTKDGFVISRTIPKPKESIEDDPDGSQAYQLRISYPPSIDDHW